MKKIATLIAASIALSLAQGTMAQPIEDGTDMSANRTADEILAAFAASYRTDPMAISSTFGVRLGDRWWTVSVERTQEAYHPSERLTAHRFGPHAVTLSEGEPPAPTWYFHIASEDVLNRIAAGSVNAGTAAMQSFGSDRVGVEIETMDGFQMTAGAEADMYVALSHFWTTGVPEITVFGRDSSLPTHGVAAVSLHTMKGYRIGWFSIGTDDVANEDQRLEAGQVPNLFIITRGRGRAQLADDVVELTEGMSVFVPPYTRHVLSNPYDEPMEGVLVLFGDNSDFAFGTSYPEFTEDLNRFYGEYPFRR